MLHVDSHEDSPGKGYFCPERRTVTGGSKDSCSEIICSSPPRKMKPGVGGGGKNSLDNCDGTVRGKWPLSHLSI